MELSDVSSVGNLRHFYNVFLKLYIKRHREIHFTLFSMSTFFPLEEFSLNFHSIYTFRIPYETKHYNYNQNDVRILTTKSLTVIAIEWIVSYAIQFAYSFVIPTINAIQTSIITAEEFFPSETQT